MTPTVKNPERVECLRYAIVSTAHMTEADAAVLATLDVAGGLPWWIITTDYGYQLRLHEFDPGWEDEARMMGLGDDVIANVQGLQAAGFDAVTFDRDADAVDGLATWEW